MTPLTPVAVPPQTEPVPVEEAARDIARELQAALAAVVAGLPAMGGAPAARAVDLQRNLGLNKKLGWQLFKFVTAADPLSDLAFVPGEPSMRRILGAASRRRAPREAVGRAAAAFNRFEAFVIEHGSDRSELISLASGLTATGGADHQHDLKTRKSVFKGLTHIWGIKTELSVRTMVFGAGAPGTQDLIGIRGDLGLQRLRRGVPLTIAMYTQDHPRPDPKHDGPARLAVAAPTVPIPVRREQALRGLHVLGEFSSQPLPSMEPRTQPDGSIETDVVFPPSGRSGAVMLYAVQHVAATARGEQTLYQQGAVVRIPCAKMICEILVPEGWSDPATARVAVYGRRDGVDRVFDRRTTDLLPQRETATYLGLMEVPPPMPGSPRHPDAVRRVLELAGWNQTRYDVYRCSVDYPVLHTMISLDVDAAKR